MNNSLVKPKYTEEEYEAFFQRIKEVLENNIHITKYQLMNGTGIPMDVIKHFIKEGRIEETISGTLNSHETPKDDKERRAENFRKGLANFQKNNSFDNGSKLVKDLDKKYHHER